MTVQRGDVVIVDYPYPSGVGRKRRPAVVIQNDTNNRRLKNTIVVGITSNTSRVHEPTQLLIRVATPEGQQSGVFTDSAVTCENLLTVEIGLIGSKIGHLSAAMMAQIDECLKASLAIL
jgi:mRNA interferase MazF